MTDRKTLDQARKWANDGPIDRRTIAAAAEVIRSLPDEIVDGERVRDAISAWEFANISAGEFVDMLRDLLPKPADPRKTLADMTPDERKACQWRQVEVAGVDGELGAIVLITRHHASVMWADGNISYWDYQDLTPRLDLPPLKWPGSEEEGTTEPEFDPAYLYRDYGGDVWECINGEWVTAGTPNERKDLWELGAGVYTPIPKCGPYTRIDKKGASHE